MSGTSVSQLMYQNETFLRNSRISRIIIAKHGAIHIESILLNLSLTYQKETFLDAIASLDLGYESKANNDYVAKHTMQIE